MANLKIKNDKWCSLSLEEAKDFGANMLGGIKPQLIGLNGQKVFHEKEWDYGPHDLDFNFLTDDNLIPKHIDFHDNPFAFVYDLGAYKNIEKIHISGCGKDVGNLCINDFELYASDDKDNILSLENRIFAYKRGAEEPFCFDGEYYKDFVFEVEGKTRYFALKNIGACPFDSISRIARIGLFSKEYTELKRNIPAKINDCLFNLIPQIKGEFKGNKDGICNYHIFEGIEALGDIAVSFKNGKKIAANKLYIFGEDIEVSSIKADKEEVEFYILQKETQNIGTLYEVDLEIAAENIEIEFIKGSKVYNITSDSSLRTAKIKTQKVMIEDFIGGGVDVFPNAFSKMSLDLGYNDVYWELEKHHIQKAKPHCVRMWFQVDWVVDTLEQYNNLDLRFDLPEFKSVVEYCKAFKEQGIEVELDFGWKIGTKIWDWFCIKGIPDDERSRSAPADLYQYGQVCVKTLEHLVLDLGLDNIKYLSFYNEPNCLINSMQGVDFKCWGDTIAYWGAMMKYTYNFLQKSPLKDKIEIWACEESDRYTVNLDRINNFAPECFTTHSIHRYFIDYDYMCSWYDNQIIPYSDGKPVVLTEYGQGWRSDMRWDRNHVCNLLAGAMHGVSGAFVWVMAGSPLVDPININWCNSTMQNADNNFQHWAYFPDCETLDEIGESYYELSLPNNYIPFHAKALWSMNDYDYSDCRVNGFHKDGEYTVLVESKGDIKTNIEVKFDKEIGKKFYKMVYKRMPQGEGNMTMPHCVGEFNISDTICDEIGEEYSLTVYTTIKPIPQVIMDKVNIIANPGDKIPLGARVLDSDETPVFSISKSLCDGAKIEDGYALVPETAKKGDMFAIKAELPTGQFGIALVRIGYERIFDEKWIHREVH